MTTAQWGKLLEVGKFIKVAIRDGQKNRPDRLRSAAFLMKVRVNHYQKKLATTVSCI